MLIEKLLSHFNFSLKFKVKLKMLKYVEKNNFLFNLMQSLYNGACKLLALFKLTEMSI